MYRTNHATLMKTMQLLLATAIFAIGFISCNLEKKRTDINYQLLAEDASVSDNINSDSYRIADQESRSGQFSDSVGKTGQNIIQWVSSVDTCAIVTLNTNGGNFPMTLEINFGTGCTDAYGVHRKGIVNLAYSGFYSTPGTEVTMTFNNYYVNNHKVEGTKMIANEGRNGQNKLVFGVDDNNGRITKPDGGIITWNSTRKHTWLEGEGTLLWICDDVYGITGSAHGEISDGTPYAIQIDETLQKNVCCPYLDEGVITYSVDGIEVATVDYGNGTCDATANLTANGNTYVIVIQ